MSPETDVTFDLAGPDDEEGLLEMIRDFYAHEGLSYDDVRARRALARLLADDALGRVWIVRSGGETAGYFVVTFGYSLEFGGRDAFLDELYLRDAFRGSGLGRKAIERATEACRELGIEALHLEVERHNTSAQGFYRRLGFHDHDRYLMTRWVAEPAPRHEGRTEG